MVEADGDGEVKRKKAAARKRFSEPIMVLEGTDPRATAVAAAFDAADRGDYKPGIALGIFSEDAGEDQET